jgi:hypothetical protein
MARLGGPAQGRTRTLPRISDLRRNTPGSLTILTAIRRAFGEQLSAETDLAVASGGPNAGPKAKENGRPERERNHSCVPQRHGATD